MSTVAAFALFAVVLMFVFTSLAATNRCVEWQPFWPKELTGWHQEGNETVKCYRGTVVDYR